MTKSDKRKNFKKVSKKMLDNALKDLKRLENLTNTSYYDYDWNDIKDLIEPLEAELALVKDNLRGITRRRFKL